jgi:hypothetical protein
MDKTLVFTTVEHARIIATGVPVQFEIVWALVAFLGVALTVALVRCRHFGDNDLAPRKTDGRE